MTIIENTLAAKISIEHDSGDYPSGAGSGPRKPKAFVEEIQGHVIIGHDPARAPIGDGFYLELLEMLNDAADESVPGIRVIKWSHTLGTNKVTATVAEFNAARYEIG